MRVRDIMTQPPETCRVDTDLATASRRMKETGCGTLAVLDAEGRLAGILTDRDLAVAIGETKRDAWRVAVDKAMTHRVHTCRPDDDVHAALDRMATAKVRRLPVVDAQGGLKGVISIDDVIVWGVQEGGIDTQELARALQAICGRPAAALEIDLPRS